MLPFKIHDMLLNMLNLQQTEMKNCFQNKPTALKEFEEKNKGKT